MATKFGSELQMPGRPLAPPGLNIIEPRLGEKTNFGESLISGINRPDLPGPVTSVLTPSNFSLPPIEL